MGNALATVDFESVSRWKDIEPQLKVIAQQDYFAWMGPIVGISLPEYVKKNLPPRIDRSAYAPWAVEENLAEAGRVLNEALNRRSEILELEATAINAALELQLAQQVQPIDISIARVALQAGIKMSSGTVLEGASQQSLTDRKKLLDGAREARLALHARSGSALNYGERVEFLRRLYVDSIRRGIERLYAAWIGLDAHFGIALSEPPGWDPGKDSLGDLVFWARDAASKIAEGTRHESVHDILILLGAQSLIGDRAKFTGQLRAAGSFTCGFNIGLPLIPNAKKDSKIRLLGLGIAMTYGDVDGLWRKLSATNTLGSQEASRFTFLNEYLWQWRQSISGSVRVKLPEQKSTLKELSEAEKAWNLEPINLHAGIWSATNATASIPILQQRQHFNACPIGDWEVVLPDMLASPTGLVNRHSLGLPQAASAEFPALSGVSGIENYSLPQDVAVLVRVAVRD